MFSELNIHLFNLEIEEGELEIAQILPSFLSLLHLIIDMKKCKLCGYIFDEDDLEHSIEDHLQEAHYLSYQDYYEILTLSNPYVECWKCGAPRYTISPYLNEAFLPCLNCTDLGDKHKVKEIRSDITGKVKDFQAKLGRSKFYQYLVSLDPRDRERLLPKDYEKLSEVLTTLKKSTGVRLEKSSIFRVTNALGRSSEISERNMESLGMEVIEFKVLEEKNGRFQLGNTGLYLTPPEIIPFDPKHHSRGSILNPAAKRASRRIRFSETGECIKFFNTPNLSVKSIFSLTTKDGGSVSYLDLPEETRWGIRSGVLKTKPILSRILEVYNEVFKYLSWIDDPVFLLNSFEIPTLGTEMRMKLTWSWEEQNWEETENNYIKISAF